MKINKEFVLREIAGDYILVPVGNTAMEFNGLITLNEVSALLWEKMQNEVSLEQLIDAVLEEYEVDRTTATQDVEEFVDRLKETKILD
ncbi:MAG: PqqD family protein [Lachnospiraceae bacterium]|nr:PqqD family protein [Lachnospiraceae bacterium]